MVNFTAIRFCSDSSYKLIRKHMKGNFIDTLRLTVRGGSGGSGYPKFGGVGGAGGNVYIECAEDLTLKDVISKHKSKKVNGAKGGSSERRCILGARGEDTVIKAPVGINVYNAKNLCIGELNEVGKRVLVARGGMGGQPETGYCGLHGEVQVITIDLKLIADIGFVGFPNAGKSTLLSSLSKAKPKIASYPFTTIKPNIGIMSFKDNRSISLADLPGLIEGAHINIGMGHRFLRHVERTKLLLLVVDIQGFQLSPKHISRDFLQTIVLLNKELELYRKDLLDKPAVLIVNKMDRPDAKNILRDNEKYIYDLENYIESCPEEMRPNQVIQFEGVIPYSAKFSGLTEMMHLKKKLRAIIDEHYGEHDVEKEAELYKAFERKVTEKAATVVV